MNYACLAGNWNYPTTVWSGPGRIRELPQACRTLGMSRPLLVTDMGLARTPMVEQALSVNQADGLSSTLFARVKGNPTGGNVAEGVEFFRAGGHDGVIAFGGGSAIDAAKAIALMTVQDRPLWDFEDIGDHWRRVNTDGLPPVIAVPTTAGTGSEVGRASVIVHESEQQKKIIFHPRMMPAIVIADPELTVGLSPHITAATGMDAFVHSFEAYCVPAFHPMADGIALEGMRLVATCLERAYRDGADIEARAGMLAAASMGAAAFQKGLGAVHALAHPIGAVFDTHHGLANAVLLPYVMAHNRQAIEPRMAQVARALGLSGHGFEDVLDWVITLRRALGIPHALSQIGISADSAEVIGRLAALDPSMGGNPVAADARALSGIFRAAHAGRL
ncbi:MAG: iron-containing alcohol dehydrogenase [Burkholderiaceae bacterium]